MPGDLSSGVGAANFVISYVGFVYCIIFLCWSRLCTVIYRVCTEYCGISCVTIRGVFVFVKHAGDLL